jgi:hypothetical protein
MPTSLVPSACLGLLDALNKVRDERNGLSDELKSAAPGEKPAIAAQIKQILPKLGAAEAAYLNCVKAHPNKSAKFAATVKVAVMADVVVHTSSTDTIAMEFDTPGGKCVITNFPGLALSTVHVLGHDDAITVTLNSSGSGTFTKATGAMSVTTEFNVHHSIFGASDSKVTLHFTTGTVPSPLGAQVGSPMNAAGMVTLVGAGKFQGGSADGLPVAVSMSGKVSPHP